MTRTIRTLQPATVRYLLDTTYSRAAIRDLIACYGGRCPECGGDAYIAVGPGGIATKPCPCCVQELGGDVGDEF